MSDTFLTPVEVVDLSGRKKPKLQREWLIENGYQFDVRADGRPALLRSAVEARHGVRAAKPAEPNWAVLE